MSRKLTIKLTYVECFVQQTGEAGKDEMILLGFGATDAGQALFIKPVALGSYNKGDKNKVSLPITLLDRELSLSHHWARINYVMVEQDFGAVLQSSATLWKHFEYHFVRQYRYLREAQPELSERNAAELALARATSHAMLKLSQVAQGNYYQADDIQSLNSVTYAETGPVSGPITQELFFYEDANPIDTKFTQYGIDMEYTFPKEWSTL